MSCPLWPSGLGSLSLSLHWSAQKMGLRASMTLASKLGPSSPSLLECHLGGRDN